ncbi:TPR-like protein [Coprinopsis sp. MPI-PUGE-AT-0042]|nr:TPR-like protein [Coprinopsis sp. MPI-PUGE-AT-0042]
MDQETSSLAPHHASSDGELYLTDIILERTDTANDDRTPLSLTELWVFGIPDSEEGNCYTLTNGTSGQWHMTDFIQLPAGVAVIDCVVKSKEGEDVAFAHLDLTNSAMRSAHAHSKHGHIQSMEIYGEGICLVISWKTVETPLDTILPTNDIGALNDIGVDMMREFERTGDLVTVNEAMAVLYRVVQLTPEGHANLPACLNNLGSSFQRRFERTGDLSDIAEAISAKHRVVQLTPEGHADLPGRLNNLGNSFQRRFEHTGDLSDIAEAISAQHRAVQLTPEGHAALPGRLNNLGNSFQCRFEHTGDLSDIAEAISAQHRAVQLTPEGHAALPGRLNNIGTSFQCRFEHTGDLSDIAEAISAKHRAVQLTPEGHAALPACLNNIGNSFQSRFEHTGDLSDIAEAISAQHRAVQLTPEGHADLPGRLNNLGNSFQRRFEHTGDLSDIAEAISAKHRAVQLTPEDHADLPGHLNNLGSSFQCRFEHTGDLSDIAEAISAQHRAVQLTPEGHAALPGCLNNLGNSFQCRFEHTGDLSDIAEAISAKHRAVQLTPEGHAALPACLNNIGNSFQSRFEHTGDLSDIAEAISAQHRAVQLTPEGHADLPGRLNNLGNSFQRRFEHTGDLSDIAEAISAQHRAVQLTPEGHAALPACLNNLGNSFQRRFEHTGDLSDIAEAISAQHRAVQLTPEDHADLPGHLNNLGSSFQCRFEHTGDLSDIAEAISAQHRAVQLTPEGHAALPGWLNNLGASFLHRFERTHSQEDLAASISNYKSAATSTFGPPRHRLVAARTWANLLNQHYPQSLDTLHAFDTALSLIALIAGLEESVRGRYSQLHDICGIVLKAASAACSLGQVDKALEWLEQGRCVVWSQLSNLRTPLDDLHLHNSQLAQSVANISKQLENAGSSRGQSHFDLSTSEKMLLEDEARAHLKLARRWDELLKTIRSIPGFESFLQPLPCSSLLQHLPVSGPVVVINVDEQRCDAIALLAGLDEPLHIPLPDFSLEKANKYRGDLKANLESQQLRMQEVQEAMDEDVRGRTIRPGKRKQMQSEVVVHKILRDLWNEVVSPILNTLGLSRVDLSSTNPLPRIWWCPTGPLSFLPIHAAGTHSERVLDYVVSSYIPTVTALTNRVKDHRQINKDISGLFLTSQPSAPGTRPIPGTTTEARSIHRMATHNRARVTLLEGSALTIAKCLQHMENHSCIHLACHASQNVSEPLQSQFLFHNGSLDLATIIQRDLKNADLAFLSACQTSAGDEKLSDEAVHLAAGMLAAGYLRVVATMWSIGDGNAPEVANDFYSYLFGHREEGSGNSVDGSVSAYALHHAVQQLRRRLDNSENSLLAWAPYVHFGY